MSLYALADHMAAKGRNGDSMLVHMAPSEVAGLHALALAHGERVTINPETGLPEMFSLKKILKAVLPAVAGFALGPAGFGLMSSLGAAATVGGATALATGSLSRGLMAGLGAYGGASLGEGLASLGSTAISPEAMAAANASADPIASLAAAKDAASMAGIAAPTGFEAAKQGFQMAARDPKAFMNAMGGGAKTLQAGYMAASPMMADEGIETKTKMPDSQGYLRPYVFDPYTQGLQALTPVSHKEAYGPPPGSKEGGLMSLARGGAVAFADGGDVNEQIKADLARLSASGDPGELDRWLATTAQNYSLDQLSAASGYNPEDIRKAMYRASQDYARYWQDEMLTKQGTTIDPTSEVGQQRIADVRMGFDALKEDPVKLQQAMYKTGVGVGDLANATGLDAGTLAAWLRTPLVNSGLNFDQFYEFYNKEYPGSQTVAGPGPSRRLDVGYYKPMEYGSFDPESVLYFDAQGKRSADAIRQWWQNNQGKASPQELDKFLVDSGFSAEMINQALPQFGVGDLQNAIAGAAKRLGRSPQTLTPSWGSYTPQNPYAASGRTGTGGGTGGGAQPGPGLQPPPAPGPAAPPPPAQPPGPPPVTPGPGPIRPEDAMSGRSLEAYNALMGKGSTATKQWDVAPMRPYLPQTGNQYFIQRGDKVVDTKNPFKATTPTSTTTFTDPNQAPTAPPGPGMEWFWDGINKMWLQRPVTSYDSVGGLGGGDSGGDGGSSSGDGGGGGGGGMGNSGEGGPGSPGGWARGGYVPSYALGGLGSLGGYSDGGRLLKGPGDGVSDSIPATIGDRRPARLADGEFVVPARIVSELGNGSTDAGARKLYSMMDRVQRARGKTTGKGRVAVNTRADKYLPA